jgi:hypothetical protein
MGTPRDQRTGFDRLLALAAAGSCIAVALIVFVLAYLSWWDRPSH